MTLPPSRHVQPDVSEARVDRLWQGLESRLEKRPARPWRWLVLGTALAGAAAGGVLWLDATRSAAAERAVLSDAKLETKTDELSVTLGDGSSVKLASQSEVRVQGSRSSAIALSLARGELSCDVTHREGRKFTVLAGDVEVRVIGTRFSVRRTAGAEPRVEVSVSRGVVEVRSARRPDVVARVAAGQNWIESSAEPEPLARAEPPAAPAVASVPSEPELQKREISPAASAPLAVPAARELFEKAAESRRAGDAAAAARAYEELLRLHPGDARASLAAFELGRLRMDRLGDRAGAITALERAVALQVGPTFREDALARLVSVYAAQGNFKACQRARDRYLSSYPRGVHAGAVTTRCGSPNE
jgi:transmembrane sensor